MKKLTSLRSLFLLLVLSGYMQVSAQIDKSAYDEVGRESEGLTRVKKNGKTGFVDNTGKLVIPLEYDAANGFFEGLSAVMKDKQVGYINKYNELVIPMKFRGGYNFKNGVCLVSTGNDQASVQMWMIDRSGNPVTNKYRYIHTKGRFRMTISGEQWGYMREDGKEIVPPVYSMVHNVSEGVFGAQKDNLWGFIDTTGNVFLPFEYEDISLFEGGLARVKKNGLAGVINKRAEAVIPFVYKTIYSDSATGWYKAENSRKKWGYIDRTGKIMIPFEFDYIADFVRHGGDYAVITVDKLKGLVNRNGDVVIPAQYKEIRGCESGLCHVISEEGLGMYSIRKGKEIVPPKYFLVHKPAEGVSLVQAYDGMTLLYGMGVGGKYGYVDQNGKEITEMNYSKAEDFENGKARVSIDGENWFYIDRYGKKIN